LYFHYVVQTMPITNFKIPDKENAFVLYVQGTEIYQVV